jgi:hypothetical protein
MPFDFGSNLKMDKPSTRDYRSGWSGGVAQSTQPVSDLTPQVTGGQDGGQDGGGAARNSAARPSERRVLHVSIGLILGALLLLWLMGGLVFRSARS